MPSTKCCKVRQAELTIFPLKISAAHMGPTLCLCTARPKRRTGRKQDASAYLQFWMARAATLLLNPRRSNAVGLDLSDGVFLSPTMPAGALPPNASTTVALALTRSCEVAFDEVCRQLAYYTSRDDNSFDVVVLCYSLLTYVLIGDSLGHAPVRTRKEAARDAVGVSILPPHNKKLVAASLEAIFGKISGGLWPPGQPIFQSRGGGNNVGNAFVFSPDMLASLLEVLPSRAFLPHLAEIESHLSWLEDHVLNEVNFRDVTCRGTGRHRATRSYLHGGL